MTAAFRRLTIDDVTNTILDKASGRKVKATPVDVPHIFRVDIKNFNSQRRQEQYAGRIETAVSYHFLTQRAVANAYVAGNSVHSESEEFDLVPVQFYRVRSRR